MSQTNRKQIHNLATYILNLADTIIVEENSDHFKRILRKSAKMIIELNKKEQEKTINAENQSQL